MAVVQTSPVLRTAGSGSSSTLSFSSNLTAGNASFLFVGNYPSGISTVSGSSSGSYTKAIGYNDGGDNWAEIWYKENVAGGAETITITPTSTSGNYITAYAQEHSGIATSGSLNRTGSVGGNNTVTASAANTQANCLVLTMCVADVGNSNCNFGTATTGYTLVGRENDSNTYTGMQACYKYVSSVETSAATITSSISGAADQVLATFSLAAANNIVTITPSGGVVFGGAADSLRNLVIPMSGGASFSGTVNLISTSTLTVSGGLTLSGDGGVVFEPATGTSTTITPSGGVVFSGDGGLTRGLIVPVSGGILLSGAVTVSKELGISSSGGAVFSGNGNMNSSLAIVPSGQVSFGGSSSVIFIPVSGPAATLIPKITIGIGISVS